MESLRSAAEYCSRQIAVSNSQMHTSAPLTVVVNSKGAVTSGSTTCREVLCAMKYLSMMSLWGQTLARTWPSRSHVIRLRPDGVNTRCDTGDK
eukprot:scaffold36376_cov27-Tisochrysis_lutea.AAC.2